jgi:hypothetical protein
MAVPTARRNTTIIALVLYLITIPFLILVLIGNISDSPVLRDTWFFRLDVSQIIPISAANSNLLNSVARSLGLHDFYQVGLWNFCEGYNDEGITYCSTPEPMYWFNPVQILVSELLSGAQIALPSEITTILTLLRYGQRIMFIFFLVAICLNFILLCTSWFALRSRWVSLGLSLTGFISALLVTIAAILATAMSIAFRVAATSQDQLNIQSDIGIRMFVFMWIAALATDFAFILHAAMGCCCKPQRREKSAHSSQAVSPVESNEKRPAFQLPTFVRRRKAGASS